LPGDNRFPSANVVKDNCGAVEASLSSGSSKATYSNN